MATHVVLWAVAGYLSGSIPFALLLGKMRGVDIRKVGSGNVGATNLGRTLGRNWGLLAFLLDMLKGLVPVLAAGVALGYAGRWSLPADDAWRWLAIALTPVLGHVFPLWLGFRGGKGVATGLGVMLGLWPLLTLPGIAAGITWCVIVKMARLVSLASVAAACLLPLFVLFVAWLEPQSRPSLVPLLTITAAMAALVTLRHRANLARIAKGTEPRIKNG